MEEYIICDDNIYKVGEIYELYFNPDNRNNVIFQIRAIVDDEWVVFKYENNNHVLRHKSWFIAMKNNLTYKSNWG